MQVALFIGLELLVFPTGCGVVLDIATLPLFESATLAGRIAFYDFAPLTAFFCHWLVGTICKWFAPIVSSTVPGRLFHAIPGYLFGCSHLDRLRLCGVRYGLILMGSLRSHVSVCAHFGSVSRGYAAWRNVVHKVRLRLWGLYIGQDVEC
jgi:hypothetical protein